MAKDTKEDEFDMFKLGYKGIIAEANRYLAEKEKERKNDGKKNHVD